MKTSLSTLLLLSCAHASMSYAQTCESGLTANATDSHYSVNADGTIVDKKTNLTWMRCAIGQTWADNTCTGVPQLMQWEKALETAKNTTFAGQQGWRVPTQEELQSLVDKNCEDPAIDVTAFPNVPSTSVYWSSSDINNNGAWVVNFFDGDDYWSYKYDYEAVRLVKATADCSTLDADQDGVNDCLDKCPNSMAGSKVNESGCLMSIELKGVQFDLDSALLTADSKRILDQVAQDLIKYPGDKKDIEVQGHTTRCSSF